ncbi:fasciclin domain-containing protein [Vibrio splendidus]|uniref:fasciclin domain-containing protein n=1 Tax=Vibrio splendidus TaxID=29497 RepID=UPI0024692898|nr:fasciclin domain-containing protein [Vibrio splendidus]MDH5910886.1 fasciclin domain-containing protein [Vibrio splendidus]MDH5940490.1 fasciclin domain-containing protein [Vibrio splendidus]MDH5983744.1 fasciclin domain-containing protein [Vibrio splendidus]MDH5992515.1 fasciclin domain-containing protein [Vibrio splendidus]MDH6003671.1 fasciclin domain-containing protein [Vibrio splendidus]
MFNKLIKTTSALVATLLFTAFAHANHHEMKKDIVDVAAENGSFNTLVAAVKAADLVDTLKGEGPFTVLAPSDEAFAALPEGTVDMLLKPENKDKLVAVLTYHVIPGKIMAAEVMKLNSAVTVQGSAVMIAIDDGNVMIDNAKVIMPDVEASNGVIHVIDAVLLPK